VILVEKVLFLKHVSLFSRMSVGDLGRVAEIAEEVVYAAHSNIFREGDYGETLFIIVDGSVQIARRGELLALLQARDYFGEMSILDGEPRSASATASSDCLLLKISQEEFHDILSTHFDTALAVIKTLSRNLRSHVVQYAHQTEPEGGSNA
jgi:CRP/FNR family transcriptional regulator, cyclic AMP receptor protein